MLCVNGEFEEDYVAQKQNVKRDLYSHITDDRFKHIHPPHIFNQCNSIHLVYHVLMEDKQMRPKYTGYLACIVLFDSFNEYANPSQPFALLVDDANSIDFIFVF